MILYCRMVVLGLMLILQGQDAIKDEAKECILSCRRKIEDDVCKHTCLELLQEHTTNETQAPLLNPGVPTFVSSEFRSIRLVWNSTNRFNQSAVRYIVNVDPKWNHRHQGGNVIFPYVKKYYKTNKTIYTVENLLAKTKYRFRVAAVSLNETSPFSNWSDIFNTNYTCLITPCSVTNVRLELTLFKPDKQMTELTGTLYWEPTTGLEGLLGLNPKSLVVVNLPAQVGYCNIKFQHEFSKKGEKAKLTNKNCSSLPLSHKDSKLKTDLHFGCLYNVKIGLQDIFEEEAAIGQWKFYIPKCLAGVCGCEFSRENIHGNSFVHINLTQTSKNTSSLNVIWNNENWWEAINITYYRVNLKCNIGIYQYQIAHVHINSAKHIYNYSKSFSNLTNGRQYTLEVSAFHSDSCIHEQIKTLEFLVSYPCRNKSACTGSAKVCTRNEWLGKTKCDCLPGFREVNEICVDSNPCRNHSCPPNSSCYMDGHKGRGFTCRCDDGFIDVNNTCQVIDICKENNRAKGCMTAGGLKNDNTVTIVASVVPPLVFIVIIASLLLFYQRRYQNKRLGTLARVMDSVAFNSSSGITTLTNNYDYQHPVTVALPPTKGYFEDDRREPNVLYVPIEIKNAIAKGLTDGIFELSSDRLKLDRVIGKGAFGEVYHGEAHGIVDNLGWTTVAVKKLSDSASISEIHDFMEEIELMKLLGRHDNVIQMYGCCTLSPPTCLIMEFATGGNMLDYLRSLKRKGEKTALIRKDPGKHDICESEKNKFEKFFEPGEMPHQLEAHLFPGAEPLQKDSTSNNNVKQAEAENVEIATKVNQEIQTVLDPKELESFARQIASGMTHVADLGIIHRDLAARNILLDENKVLKISDFGLSREGIYVKKTGGKIPLRWLSIEAIQERRYSTASDVWAFGIVLWEICTLGDVPYPFVSDKDLLDFLISGKRMKKAASCTDEIFEIMLKCWRYRPQDRPSFTELSKFLWQLEHEGSTYVNIEPLITSSLSLPPNEAECRTGDPKQEKYANSSYEPESSSEKSPSGIDNPGFWKSIDDLNFDDQQHILPRKQKSQFKNKDAENPALPVSDSILNRGDDAANTGQNTPDT